MTERGVRSAVRARRALAPIVVAATAGFLSVAPAAAALGERTIAVSVNDNGQLGNGVSFSQSISADGRFVAFESQSSNLGTLDLNGEFEIFVRDLQNGRTERITTGPLGLDSDYSSGQPVLSADGRFVAFSSEATNLVLGDTNDSDDIYVFDREKKAIERVSLPTGVASNDVIGGLGRQANGNSEKPALSADGRFVAFDSYADNLVPGDANGLSDVFVRDRRTGVTERISVGPGGRQTTQDSGQAVISADGRYVAYESWAPNLVPGDTNDGYDVFVYDRVSHTQERVSVDSAGHQANGASFAPTISADGRFVAFDSVATDLVAGDTNGKYDVFLRDRKAATTIRVSVDGSGRQVGGDSGLASISGDGRYVGYHSFASALVPHDVNGARDAFRYDRLTGAVVRVSVTDAGADAIGTSGAPSLSGDGRRVAFDSLAANLASSDTNNTDDVFVRELPG
jgi:Tol biopolymer transport system component